MKNPDVSHLKVIVLVFAMPECGACEEYTPRLLKRVNAFKRSGHPFVVYKSGMSLNEGQIPIFLYNVASDGKGVQALADQYKIEATPTTLVLVRPEGALRLEGAINDAQIDHVLTSASAYNNIIPQAPRARR